jgi:hypothetical protein
VARLSVALLAFVPLQIGALLAGCRDYDHFRRCPDSGAPCLDADGSNPGGGGITFVGVQAQGYKGVTGIGVPVPAGVTAGDLLVAIVAVGLTGNPNPCLTPPLGWTLAQRLDHPNGTAMVVYWRVADTSEPGSYTWSSTASVNGVAWMLAYSGVNPGSPIDVQAGLDQARSDTSYGSPTLTTTAPGALVIATFVGHHDPLLLSTNSWSLPAVTITRTAFNNGADRSAISAELSMLTPGQVPSLTATASLVEDYALVHLLALTPRP